MKYRILFVDDDLNILNSFKRMLRNSFDMELAVGPAAGLAALEKSGPFAVVIADMKMPEMSGIEFLKIVRKKAPNMVRLMLTGNVDQTTAVQAVNEGQVFKFLNKPCTTEELTVSINEALEHHRIISAEKELLQNTLVGSIKILTDILHLSKSNSGGRSIELRDMVRSHATHIAGQNLWELELAAMLSEIGFLTVPSSIIEKFYTADVLSPQEQAILNKLPETSFQLLHNLPRLEKVAELVKEYLKALITQRLQGTNAGNKLGVGATTLLTLNKLLDLKQFKQYDVLHLTKLLKDTLLNRQLLEVLIVELQHNLANGTVIQTTEFSISLKELCAGQVLMKDIKTADGMLIAAKGHTLNSMTIQRIKNYADLKGLGGEIVVNCLMPTAEN